MITVYFVLIAITLMILKARNLHTAIQELQNVLTAIIPAVMAFILTRMTPGDLPLYVTPAMI